MWNYEIKTQIGSEIQDTYCGLANPPISDEKIVICLDWNGLLRPFATLNGKLTALFWVEFGIGVPELWQVRLQIYSKQFHIASIGAK